MSNRARGDAAESYAREWLEARGLRHVESNYHCRLGEIDLVMREKDVLVFVEVRLRKHNRYGGAAASVDSTKQRKLLNTARHYISARRVSARQTCRFDVLAVEPGSDGWEIDWLQNAISE